MPRAAAATLFRTLQEGVEADGTLGFDRFMETVLYHPELGYFARHPERAGRRGDFLTAPEASPLFAECVAQWVERLWQTLGKPEFHLVEAGAGRGTLALGLLESVPEPLRQRLRLHLVERGAAPRRALKERFEGRQGDVPVQTYRDVAELPAHFEAGVFVANELFDNLPVRRIMRADGWKEIRLRPRRGRLEELLRPAPAELVDAALAAGLRLAEGQSAEVSPNAVPVLATALGRLDRGGLLVFDYGGEAGEISGDAAPQGTLRAHRRHAATGDLYAALGEQDITAHVNFTPLRAAAEAQGFAPCRLEAQAQFLLGTGLLERLEARLARAADEFERLKIGQSSKWLYHPDLVGEGLRVLYAQKPGVGGLQGKDYPIKQN